MSKRVDPELAPAYRKNAADEAFIEVLNARLHPFEEADYHEVEQEYPTLNIIGVPRSGTTLLNQLLASHLNIGHINHLIAVFWQAPVHGIRLSRKLLGSGVSSSFSSEFGRTKHLDEPHEFGYFWSELLNYREPLEKSGPERQAIDWDRVRQVILNMTDAFQSPIVFKSFFLGWHIDQIQGVLPKSCFLRVRRPPLDTALSLIQMRRQMLGSVDEWASMRPKQYSWLRHRPYWEQVAGQVYFLERTLSREIDAVQSRNVIEFDYETICQDPGGVVDAAATILLENGWSPKVLGALPRRFEPKRSEYENLSDVGLVENALADFYSGKYDGRE